MLKRRRGAKDQLLKERVVLKSCKWRKVKKTYDMLPLFNCENFKNVRCCIERDKFLSDNMKTWKIILACKKTGTGESKDRVIKFHCDRVAPLLFAIVLIKFSDILGKVTTGYRIKKDKRVKE